MSVPAKTPSIVERLRAGRVVIPMQQMTWPTDTVNETVRVTGVPLKSEAMLKEATARKLEEEKKLSRLKAERNAYRARERAKQSQSLTYSRPVESMSDEEIDAAIAKEQKDAYARSVQASISPISVVWNTPVETRQAMGYYTNEERELAARMNDMRSTTVFANTMPNFGREFAYNNPGLESDAFTGTSMYVPNVVMGSGSFGLPSATTALSSGLRTGWQVAANNGANLWNRALASATTAARLAAPVVSNPRWAATTAAWTIPMMAAASDGSGDSNGGFWNWIGNHPAETIAGATLAYRFASPLLSKVTRNYRKMPLPEGNPGKFKESIPTKEPEPVLAFYMRDINKPTTDRLPDFNEPEPPKPSGQRPKGKNAKKWDEQNKAHEAWMKRLTKHNTKKAEIDDEWNDYEFTINQAKNEYLSDRTDWEQNAESRFLEAMRGYKKRLGDHNKAVKKYEESDAYKTAKQHNETVDENRKKLKTGAINKVKKNWYWVGPLSYLGYKWFSGDYSNNLPSNLENTNNLQETDNAVQQAVNPADTLIVEPSEKGMEEYRRWKNSINNASKTRR